ncbi:MAG: hypothetical protein QXY45_02090 [Candidatus Aenigmatarchaeota archaeon]
MKFKKPDWLTFKNPYLFTIFALGLFIGFWLGFFVFAQVHIIVVCQPSGRTILDTRRSLSNEFVLSANVAGCERIDLRVSKPKITEIFSKNYEKIYEEEKIEEKSQIKPPLGSFSDIPEPPQGSTGLPLRETEPNGKRILTLDVFGVCSGKINISASEFGTSEKCFVKDILPYYIILENTNSTLSMKFYEGVGFTENFDKTEYIRILRLFAKDLSTIDDDIQIIKVFGPLSEYFEIGSYSVEIVPTPTGYEKVVSFPLYVKESIPSSIEWSHLSFYLYMWKDIYYIGDIWFYVV